MFTTPINSLLNHTKPYHPHLVSQSLHSLFPLAATSAAQHVSTTSTFGGAQRRTLKTVD